MRIAVMGSGGIGGYLGARLAQAGEDVIFIARGSHLEAMQQNGLRVESPLGEILLRHVSATERPADVGVVDIVVFAVKAYDTESAAAAIVPLIGPATRVVTLQNGVDKMRLTPSITVSPRTDRCGLDSNPCVLRGRKAIGGARREFPVLAHKRPSTRAAICAETWGDVSCRRISLKKSENDLARNSRVCAARGVEDAGWPREPMTPVAETNQRVSCLPPNESCRSPPMAARIVVEV